MNYLSRGIIRALTLTQVFRKKILKYFSKHFRVNRNLSIYRIVFVNCKIIKVKNIKNAFILFVGEKFIRNMNKGLFPVIIFGRLEKSTV